MKMLACGGLDILRQRRFSHTVTFAYPARPSLPNVILPSSLEVTWTWNGSAWTQQAPAASPPWDGARWSAGSRGRRTPTGVAGQPQPGPRQLAWAAPGGAGPAASPLVA